jgi:hypothetical protein
VVRILVLEKNGVFLSSINDERCMLAYTTVRRNGSEGRLGIVYGDEGGEIVM